MASQLVRGAGVVCVAVVLAGLASAQGGAGLDGLQGEWRIESGFKGNEKIPEEVAKDLKFVFKGDKLIVSFMGMAKEGAVKVDNTKNPRHIDMTIDDKTALGVYQLDGDKLTLVVGEPGQKRPTELKATAAPEYTMIVLKRVKAGEGK